jgi:hypothetical protein
LINPVEIPKSLDHKIKNFAADPDSTHFTPWAPVGDVQDLRPRHDFHAKPGMKRRIRPERKNDDPVTELECFEKMFTPAMQDHVIQCTNAKVVLIQLRVAASAGEYMEVQRILN